jgi:hypothetical protein
MPKQHTFINVNFNDERLTEGEKKAARRPGVGGEKPGLWRNVWRKRAANQRKGK